jgi:hypothetical protein
VTALRARIDARRAVVVERLALAEAATPGPWECGVHAMDECRIDATGPESMTIYDEGGHGPDDARHIAANDPAVVIAECRRELAAIDADLALLDFVEDGAHDPAHPWVQDILINLAARYPEASS